MKTPLHRAILATVVLVGLSLSVMYERESLERANRMHRDGRSAEAADLYRARANEGMGDAELRYNLGTALVPSGVVEAEEQLARALSSADTEILGRANYNSGLLQLNHALTAGVPDSVRIHATAAADANRSALRLHPDNVDAKWNLAMALRLMDSIDAIERRSGRELDDGAMEADVVTRSVNVPDAAEDERAEDPPAEGENESVAVAGDESPLSLDEAADILGRSHLDATELLGKLIALESRSRWGRQPSRGIRRW
ncbi:MAG: hypothetical protein OSA81_04765 [Longimicrobiales bacterium]|nr:hypothetical protein [Longimicrobiales bacterium]